MMSDTKTILPLGAAAQADNEPGRWDYIRPDQYDKPVQARISAAEIKAIGLVIGGLGPGLLALLALVQWVSCWGQSYDITAGCIAATVLFWGYTAAAVVLALLGALALLWGRVQRIRVEVARAAITRDPYSNPVSVWEVERRTLQVNAAFFAQRQQAEIAMAPYKQYPAGLDALSMSSPAVKADAPGVLALPDKETPTLIPDRDWLAWIDSLPHLLLAGRTNAGKTTMAKAILADRLSRNEPLLVLDPHDQPGKWFSIDAIGGGRDFDAILDALDQVLVEMGNRFKEYDQGKKTEEFERLTVLIDEVPALVASTMDGAKTIDSRWKGFAKKLGSEARKVRISVILLTQSPLVADVQINSYMRENFTRLALGDQVGSLLSDEQDKARRMALAELLRGRSFAAALEYKGEIHVLNTDAVPTLAARTVTARAWEPGQQIATAKPNRGEALAKYRAWARRLDDDKCKSEVQRIARMPGNGRTGYRFSIEQIRALVGRDQNTVAQWVQEARSGVVSE